MDAPAGVSGFRLAEFVQRVDTVIVPVLPSPIDIHATTDFIKDLLLVGKASILAPTSRYWQTGSGKTPGYLNN